MLVVANIEETLEQIYEAKCESDEEVSVKIAAAMTEAAAASHEGNWPVLVTAYWKDDTSSRFRVSVEAL